MKPTFGIDFEPSGQRAHSTGESTLLELGRALGLPLESSCGGHGLCRSCAVRVAGAVAEPTEGEREAFSEEELAHGWRRACQTRPAGDCTVHLPARALSQSFSVGKALAEEQIPMVEPLWRDQGSALGLAVDLGTTNLSADLVELSSGRVLASAALTNPQISFGGDVISRLHHALRGQDAARALQLAAVEAIQSLASDLAGERVRQIAGVAVAGNTVMQHLLLGLPIEGLARAPYAPFVCEAQQMEAARLGFAFAPQAQLYCAPNVAGFVGGDHLAALLACTAARPQGCWAMLDIGTNTEIALFSDGRITSVSCASGPAFEGGRLSCGMRAAPGAIDRVSLNPYLEISTIGGQPAAGLCGSGVLSLTAALCRSGIVDKRGRMHLLHPAVHERGRSREFVLHAAGSTLSIVFTQDDLRNVQLAKGAIRTGLDLLLAEANVQAAQLDAILIAGAFGSFLDVRDLIQIGLLPRLDPERVEQVGNAAGAGVRRLLACRAARREVAQLAARIRSLELATSPDFQRTFIQRTLLDVEPQA